jgi:hypothetical protein
VSQTWLALGATALGAIATGGYVAYLVAVALMPRRVAPPASGRL